ncbi:MAG: hypothetical protein MUC36_21820 [Planctomycetes bacterium]|nr:hypothetical protein [Planctomycetota bacterium]
MALCASAAAAQQDGPPPAAPRSLEQFLLELAGRYPVSSLFRFDPPGVVSKEPILNQPEALGFAIERRLDQLPRRGQAEVVPWSGWWWPMRADGTAAGGANSPLGKYARAFGLGDAPVQWEREHHGTAGGRAPESWWGHCNGWAAAAILEPVPQRDVEINGVVLTATDLSGLLCAAYFGCHALGLDERYAGTDTPSVDSFGRPVDRAYRDINPAVLHLLASNRIGVDRKAFVADVSPGSQVWNHPVWAFEVEKLRELRDGAAAVEEITARSFRGAYPFNPAAVRFFAVTARYRITSGHNGVAPPSNQDPEQRSTWVKYDYVLETDAEGSILGGEWVRDSRTDHPDFCWVPLTPSSSYTVTPDGRMLVGTTGVGNPHVVYEDLVPLVRRSAGLPPLAVASTPVPAANGAASAAASAAGASLDQGAGRWNRPEGGADPRWTRVFQVAQSQLQRAQVSLAIATLTAPLQQAQRGQLQVPTPVQQELQLQRGWLHFLARQPQLAMADYAQLPNDGQLGPSVRARRALFAIARGDSTRALAEAAQAIAQNPQNPWGHCARAWVYLSRRAEHDEDRARDDLATAARLGADPFVAFTGLQLQQNLQQQAPEAGAGPQQQRQPVFQVQLQAMPAQWAQLFQGQVRGVQLQQEKK